MIHGIAQMEVLGTIGLKSRKLDGKFFPSFIENHVDIQFLVWYNIENESYKKKGYKR